MRYLLTLLILSSVILFSGCKKEQGCTNPQACNFAQSAEEDDGSCYLPGEECDDGIETTILDQYTNNCQCEGVAPSFGCINEDACNYSASANTENNSCEFSGDPCDDGNSATINDAWSSNCSCGVGDPILGCIYEDACNYSTSANTDDGSCYFIGDSCDDGNSTTINDTWSSSCSCTGELLGCTSTSACNYNSEADIDDDSCYFVGDGCDDGNSATINDTWSSSCSCTGELLGCNNTAACNYNSEADINNGSCSFPGDVCDDDNSATGNDTWSNSCSCEGGLLGCTISSACNYNSDADLDDGSCEYITCAVCGDLVSHEGYDYSTVLIGEQCWFSENCRYLPSVSPPSASSFDSPYYYVYDYQGTNVVAAKATETYATYGVLYNWPAVMTNGICPSGWHIPSNDEFTELTDFLGGADVAGGKMKEAGYDHWEPPNTGATNSSGFTGLSGGASGSDGFSYKGYYGCWRSSSDVFSGSWTRRLGYSVVYLDQLLWGNDRGFSARCVQY